MLLRLDSNLREKVSLKDGRGERKTRGKLEALWNNCVRKKQNSLDLLRTGLLAGLALADDGGSKAVAQLVGKFVELRVAVDFDGLFGGVANHVAVVAPSQVIF